MRIIFTDKLVAQYDNLRDMIFDLNINTAVETLEKKVFSIMDKTYWQEKSWAHLTLNDISSQNEIRVSRYLTLKNNKITVEEEQQDIDKLGTLCSERKACSQKWLTTLCLSDRRMCITWYLCSSNWDRVILKWFCHHNTASSFMHNVKTYSPAV